MGESLEEVKRVLPWAQCFPFGGPTQELVYELCHLVGDDIAGMNVQIYLHVELSDDPKVGGLRGLNLTFAPEHFSTLAEVFAEHYGAPHRVRREEYVTRGGLRDLNVIHEWTWPGIHISLDRYGPKITEGKGYIYTEAATRQMERRKAAQRQRPGQGL